MLKVLYNFSAMRHLSDVRARQFRSSVVRDFAELKEARTVVTFFAQAGDKEVR